MSAPRIFLLSSLLFVAQQAGASCGTAYCSVNTAWEALGAAPKPGWTFDVRYEYLKQDTLRTGSAKTVAAGVPGTHDEISTLNRNVNASLDYAWNARWGVSLQMPYLQREHNHIHNDPLNGAESEAWDISALGDARVLGVYQYAHSLQQGTAAGLRFGLKLPTGSTDERNAAGELAERTLQPGTGTTDLILGAYRHGFWAQGNAAWFAQAQLQQALNSHDDYRPGSQLNLDAGLSWRATAQVNALLQLNAHDRGHDHGAAAEPEDSGSRMLSLSPGLSVATSASGRIYGFVQVPLYQYVNGTQLTPEWSAVIGWRQRF
jgi:hypothetical protein